MTQPNAEHSPYYRFAAPALLDKATNSLLGIIEGIVVDQRVNDRELKLLSEFVHRHEQYRDRHPFNEILPVISSALADAVLSSEEKADITAMCERMRATNYFGLATADIQRLHAIVGAIAADGVVSREELEGLAAWLEEHEELRSCWPFDEVDTLVIQAMRTAAVSAELHEELRGFFTAFLPSSGVRSVGQVKFNPEWTVRGVCATCPEIRFSESVFCLTGRSEHLPRAEFELRIRERGGHAVQNVSSRLNYLVIGAAGNPCWAYSCYGRKVEAAVRLRRDGHPLVIVHENDVLDALEDGER